MQSRQGPHTRRHAGKRNRVCAERHFPGSVSSRVGFPSPGCLRRCVAPMEARHADNTGADRTETAESEHVALKTVHLQDHPSRIACVARCSRSEPRSRCGGSPCRCGDSQSAHTAREALGVRSGTRKARPRDVARPVCVARLRTLVGRVAALASGGRTAADAAHRGHLRSPAWRLRGQRHLRTTRQIRASPS